MGKKKTRHRTGPTFVQLFHYVLDSPAYLGLSCTARAALNELCREYKGDNNGRILMPSRYLGERLACSKTTASRALIELEEAGFIVTTKLSTFRLHTRQACEYRLTFHRCDVTFATPSRAFLGAPHGFISERDGCTSETVAA